MSVIDIVQARGVFTQALQATYNERTFPTAFLRSFFPEKTSDSRYIAISVRRGKERIAVDVERGTEGNRNSFSKDSLKVFEPPYYWEYMDATELDFYDKLFTSSGVVDGNVFRTWLSEIVERLGDLQDKIERSYERQCSQVLQTGIVTLDNGTNIDFKRKAASKVDLGGGNYWAVATVNPLTTLVTGADFLRTKGKAQGNVINVILGSTAHSDLMNNPIYKSRADVRNFQLDSVRMPQRDQVGGVLHGEVSEGSYKFRLWTYPEFFDTEALDGNSYVDPKNIIMIPEAPRFMLSFAAVPQLLGGKAKVGAGIASKRGAYLIGEYLDPRTTSHVIDIKSAGVAIPVGVDQIFTAQVVS